MKKIFILLLLSGSILFAAQMTISRDINSLDKFEIPSDIKKIYNQAIEGNIAKLDSNIVINVPKIFSGTSIATRIKLKTNKDSQLYVFIPTLQNPFILGIKDFTHKNPQYIFMIDYRCNTIRPIKLYAILKNSNGDISINQVVMNKAQGGEVDAANIYCSDYKGSKTSKLKIKNLSFNEDLKYKIGTSKNKAKFTFKAKPKLIETTEYFSKAILEEDGVETLRLTLSENIKNLYFKLPMNKKTEKIHFKLKYTDEREISFTK